MKKLKVLTILLISIIFIGLLTNFVNAEYFENGGILKLEQENSPSTEYQLQNNSQIQNSIYNSDTIYTSGNYQYKIKENFSITTNDVTNKITSEVIEDIAVITKYTGNESTVTIPKTLGGKRVFEIDMAAFYQNTSIKKLIIPDGVAGYIGQGAFADCTNLAEVSLGNSVKNIAYYAFQNVPIKSIKLPASLEFITNTTFFNCNNLTNITIDSKNVHYKVIDNVIYEYSTTGNGDLELILYPCAKKDTTYTVPSKVKSIYNESIINDYLQTINISAELEKIYTEYYALTTPNLKNINVNSANKNYTSINGVLFSKDKKIIYSYPAGRKDSTYNIPNGTVKIAQNAFYNTTSLRYIKIPNTVTYIDIDGFAYAKGLVELTIPSSVEYFGAQIFRECASLKKVIINANAENLSYLTFRELDNLEEVIVNGNIKNIIKGAFYYCPKLTKVILPNSIEKIEFGAFWCCRGLKNITIPANVVFLADCAFYEYKNVDKGYWADTKFDISKTKLKLQEDGNYMAVYGYAVKGTRDYEKAYEVLNLVNQERKKVGLNELTMDKDLLENAMKRSTELIALFEHNRPNGLDCFSAITKKGYSTSAENIAAYQTTAKIVMNSWMNSEGHKQNILTSYYTSIGIGCYKADNGNYYWVQLFTNGTPTSVTKPKNKNTTESIKILINKEPFEDVKESDWYYNAVKFNVSNHLILGYNSSVFAPNDKLTRAMMVTILYRMEGSPNNNGKSKFTDVSSNEWYSKAIKWASDNKIVNGYGGTTKFGPNDNIIRQDVAGILRNYANYKKKNTKIIVDLSKFSDYKNVESYAITSMKWAVGAGVITGNDNGTLNPKGNATRAEAAAMIQKYCNKIGK